MSRALFLLCLFLLPLPAAAQITVTINPPFANVPLNATVQFTANVTGTSNTAVTWTVLEGAVGGSITAGGLYTAPGFPGAFHVVATSQADTTQSATANAVVPGFLVPEMRSPRTFHTATSLQDGTVLLVGGQSNDSGFGGLASAEIYNPTTDAFTLTQSMSLARCCNTAALLNNGKVLIAGGTTSVAVGGSDDTSEAELYDPATGTFTVTSSMEVQRIGHTATTLQNGKVLIAGGANCASTCTTFNNAELYDPVSGTFSPTGNMTGPRQYHTATLLQNGQVLIAGGYDGTSVLGSTELYNPVTGAFTAGPAMNALRELFSATSLSDGRVLLAGGVNQTAVPLSSADIYDSTNNTITATGNLNIGRDSHTATLLTNGQVLVAGFQGQAELYNPSTGTFTLTASLNAPRFDHTANLLPNGKVLIAGGSLLGLSATSSAAAGSRTPFAAGPARLINCFEATPWLW
jgi:prolyl-tRNA editing enzyme YbaK/EbsC (Cys-tRNA(Pro) deacylase)